MNCSFCGCRIEKGTETIFVTKKGTAVYFCSGKCERNLLKLGRKPRKVKWTESYRAEKGIRIKSTPGPGAEKGIERPEEETGKALEKIGAEDETKTEVKKEKVKKTKSKKTKAEE